MYGWGNYGMGGLDYYGLLAQANLENCSPMDSACVSNNVAKQAAVEDLWVTQYLGHPGGAPDDLKLTFTPQTAAQVHEFYAPDNPFFGGNVTDTRGILAVGRGDSTPVVYQPAPVAPPVAPVAAKTPAVVTTPAAAAGKTIINSGGPNLTMPGAVTKAFEEGGIFSSLPWWAWLAGGGVALYAMKGRH